MSVGIVSVKIAAGTYYYLNYDINLCARGNVRGR